MDIEKIAGIGKAGNPDMLDGADPRLVVGLGTEAVAGEHLKATTCTPGPWNLGKMLQACEGLPELRKY